MIVKARDDLRKADYLERVTCVTEWFTPFTFLRGRINETLLIAMRDLRVLNCQKAEVAAAGNG